MEEQQFKGPSAPSTIEPLDQVIGRLDLLAHGIETISQALQEMRPKLREDLNRAYLQGVVDAKKALTGRDKKVVGNG
jgi:hypothetical protein